MRKCGAYLRVVGAELDGGGAEEGRPAPNPSGLATGMAAPLERGGLPPLLGNSQDNRSPHVGDPEMRRRMRVSFSLVAG